MHDLGDLMFSLAYLSSAERLTVVVMKARNLRCIEENKNTASKTHILHFLMGIGQIGFLEKYIVFGLFGMGTRTCTCTKHTECLFVIASLQQTEWTPSYLTISYFDADTRINNIKLWRWLTEDVTCTHLH